MRLDAQIYLLKVSSFRVFQVIASLLVGLWFSSKLWQMLFVEHSLLSRPPASSELDSNENQPESAGPRPSPVSAGAAESGEALSSPERETSSRPEQRPAVEGCVDMATSDLHVTVITGGSCGRQLTSIQYDLFI